MANAAIDELRSLAEAAAAEREPAEERGLRAASASFVSAISSYGSASGKPLKAGASLGSNASGEGVSAKSSGSNKGMRGRRASMPS